MVTKLIAYRLVLLRTKLNRLELDVLFFCWCSDQVKPLDLISFGFHPTKSYEYLRALAKLGYLAKIQDFRVFSSSGRPRSKIYVITDSGRAFVDRFLSDIADTAERLENGLMA